MLSPRMELFRNLNVNKENGMKHITSQRGASCAKNGWTKFAAPFFPLWPAR
jgi:hypothetical protein